MENIKKLHAGLLPLYLKLYDDVMPGAREKMESFVRTIAQEIKKRNVAISPAPICRVKEEFDHAIKVFEKQNLDAIITLHLAYSPSLESIESLTNTDLPLIILDTTPNFEFGPETDPDDLMYNHGIHGVQDLCSMLLRKGKYYFIETGHWKNSEVMDSVVLDMKAARLSKNMKKAVIGRIGGPFQGMGDFDLEPSILKETIGMKVIDILPKTILDFVSLVKQSEVIEEKNYDQQNFDIENLTDECHKNTILMSLAFRKWMEKEKLTAFTMNFANINQTSGFLTIPFIEASKSMSRGIGYAGEGDVLTASFVGAILDLYEDASFTEMFCPDWKNNRIFLSHMGEINIRSIIGKPMVIEKKLAFLDFDSFAMITGRFKPGKAFYLNLAPSKNKRYSFLISEVEIADVAHDRFSETVRGWMTPRTGIAEFLKKFSELGGTHHSAIVYEMEKGTKNILLNFAKLMDWDIHEV